MPLQIRLLKESDYDRLLALWREARLPHTPTGRDSRVSIVSQIAEDPEFFLGAFREDHLVGSVVATFDGRKGWINRLAVVPAERRKGVAKALVSAAESALRHRGARVIAVLVEAENAPSLSLFKHCGYKLHQDILYLTKRDSDQV